MSIVLRLACRCTSVLCLGLLIVSTAWADEYRTWTDSTGKHKVRAKLESVEDGKATLVRENGAKVKIALEKLSEADRDFVAKQDSESPFEKADDQSAERTGETGETPSGSPRTVKVDWSESQAVLLETPDAQWHATAPAVPASEYRAKSVPLPPKKDFFEGLAGMAVSRVAKTAVVGYALDRMGTKTVRLLVCDLQSGRVTASATTTGENMAPLALHDDGRQILMCRNEFGFGKMNRLEIWTIKGKNVVRSLIWSPYDGDWGPSQDVLWAEFIDAKKLATCSRGGKMAIWNLATGQPICHIQASDTSIPSLSPDRKTIAIASNDAVGLFDIEKKEVIASQKTPRTLQWPAVAFSPSGRKIGCIANDRILLWDTVSGKLEKDFALPGIPIHGAIDFPDEEFLLANNQFLIELKNQLKFWHYGGAERIRTVCGTTLLAIPGDDRSGLLLATKLPHPAARVLLKQALEQPDLFVFHKGTPVKLDVSGIPDPAQRAKATESLTKKLKDLNCPIDSTGQVDIVALVEGPKPRQISYMHSGTYQVQEYFTRLKMVYQGQTIWETSHTNIPGVISLKPGENIEGVLREASSKPTYALYDTVVLPEFLQKPSGNKFPGAGQTLGTSELTPQGLR